MDHEERTKGAPATSLTSDERVGAGRKDERSKATPHSTELFLLVAVFLLGTNPVAVNAVSAFAPLPFVAPRFTVAGLLPSPPYVCSWDPEEVSSGRIYWP